MPFLVVVVLVVAVHLATGIGAWTGVGLLADDHEMIGAAILQHRGDWTLASAFAPAPVGDAAVALYRPFLAVAFWLEQPAFGIDAFGYHVTNSVLHCLTAMVWFVLVRRWSGSGLAAAATAVLFAGWPGHAEALHWIAARTNVMSTCMLSLALLAHDVGLVRTGATRWTALAAGGLLAAVAIGTKESAVFVVPVAAAMSWMRAAGAPSLGQRIRATAASAWPMAGAAFAWLAWRAHCLGTWGSGSHYGWKAHRVGADSCGHWLQVLLAPAHHAYVGAVAAWAMVVFHLALLVAAIEALRASPARRAAAPAAVLLALGYLAGIGLEVLDPRTLENVRYTYEPALGLCVLLGLGVAALPGRARLPALAGLVVLHVFVLDANRQSWLRVSSVCTRMRDQVFAAARASQQPVRVFDGPGIHDGAFGYLNGYTQFLFWQQTAPAGTNLRGAVSSTMEWPAVLRELAAAAGRRQLEGPTHVVRWSDGALVPFGLDPQWPCEVWPGATIGYARIARERPFVDAVLPVHVLVQTAQELSVRAVAEVGGATWSSEVVRVAAGDGMTPVALALVLPPSLAVDVPVAISLRVEQGDRARTFALGDAVPGPR